jgi:hypothetical protein
MIAEEILSRIDAALDQLIFNAETLNGINLSDLSEPEMDAFQKTQESLIHHLINMDRIYETTRKTNSLKSYPSLAYKIQKKHQRFEKLKKSINKAIPRKEKKISVFSKRNRKRLIS